MSRPPATTTTLAPRTNPFAELRLEAPNGPLVGTLMAGQKSCQVQKVTGVHNLFVVFPEATDRLLDWFRFQ